MIFRRYRTIIIFFIIVSLTGALFKTLPSLKNPPPMNGAPQGPGANYPLPSADRVLINLNGPWQIYGNLGSVVKNQVYGVEQAVYGGQVNPGPGVNVPGSWDDSVAVGSFYLNNDVSGRNFRLHVLGIGGKAQVYLNGFNRACYVGDLGDTNTPQVIDIPSPRLKFGQVNTITFKLDKPAPNGPWLVWPGVTGEVYLEAVGPIMLTEPRVSVKLSGSNAELEYDIGLNTKDTGELNGQISLFDGAGNLAATNTHVLKADKNSLRLSGKLSVPNPRLWSGTDPYLYHLEVVVSGTRGARDSYVLPIGLREIQFADGGVILNKQRLEPKFLIRVAEPPGAERYRRMDADIKWAKAKGYNILYLPDGPPHPYLLDLADKYGLLVMGQAQFTGSMSQNTRPHQAGDILRSLGYHPSMLAQGLGAGLDSLNSRANEYIRKE
ncbi:MAG TPA: hypothetical protein VNU93_10130, partial [Verrucomicrobiae bacterium]|nr:hypothetical protein [Verrucomicrobiae bacterium]